MDKEVNQAGPGLQHKDGKAIHSRGMTLLEVMAALLMLLIIAGPFFSALLNSEQMTRKTGKEAKALFVAAALLESKVAEIHRDERHAVPGLPLGMTIPEGFNGEVQVEALFGGTMGRLWAVTAVVASPGGRPCRLTTWVTPRG
ncbi:type IV pilus modification PilV family protein [Heliophilum fasciatum]|uniref:Prepilin-type N-terminal cleavage/methylation domain-containing protein n=1 Tax=Heliophilum fasciatum TaxID=35700 RepID=A0A4R2RW04_9FIRM|nr:type II secretion system protein [Heliophilum fasciatum]MCW2277312.1 prepilin-type N-terminal cleavage/methylation domain-containing protein [Heliophilum fasciatum]TCP67149.1 prepilin-type N-terminal cleavage/methylation domain-containing protein [Heliophilum fasciatum]